jgi:hypothetical protein
MTNLIRCVFAGAAIVLVAFPAAAASTGSFVTERLGYDGTIERFGTKLDAQNQTNQIGSDISVSNRDIYLGFDDSSNYALGSWWHTEDTFYGPNQGRAGWGNTTGNTGVGYVQLFDADGSTDTTKEFSFGGFDGSVYTEFTATIAGKNAGGADGARLSAIDNIEDSGIFHDYSINLTVSGLQGTDADNDGLIEANEEPTGVTGGFKGLYEITEGTDNVGFYRFDFEFNLNNWAFDNGDSLTEHVSLDGGQTFFDGTITASSFEAPVAQVPVPPTALLLGLGLFGVWLRSAYVS